MSPSRFFANTVLPAPMKVIFDIFYLRLTIEDLRLPMVNQKGKSNSNHST